LPGIITKWHQRSAVRRSFLKEFEREPGSGVRTVWGEHAKSGILTLIRTNFDSQKFSQLGMAEYLSERDEARLALESGIDRPVWVRLHEGFGLGLAPPGAKGVGVDRTANVIRGCLMTGLISSNKRRYQEAFKQSDAPSLYEAAHSNSNHVEPGQSVDWRDRIGQWRDVRFVEGAGMVGDLHFNPHCPHTQQLLYFAEQMPGAIGNSHRVNAVGKRGKDGVFDVLKIEKVFSVDIVADPGTTKGMFEGDESSTRTVHPVPERKTEMTVEIAEATADQILESRPDVVARIRESMKAETEYRELVAERDALKQENAAQKAKLEEHEKAEKRATRLTELRAQAEKAIGADGKQHISDLWLETLIDLPDAKVAELIEDRKVLALGARKGAPKSSTKTAADQAGRATTESQGGAQIADAKTFAERARARA
jgi:hypothetical protein